ncbi:MAG: hypothetical protein QNJ41_12625 [Xenococcaceae cyanobacterium MO_188.B32]|nr:hypothetical protein [Xenococcaceae cyanobacterium MO_188.B32]
MQIKANFDRGFYSIFQFLLIPVTGLVCLSSIVSLQRNQLTAINQSHPEKYAKQEQAQKIKLNLLNNIPTFGFSNLVANWAFLDFIQYFGDRPARNQTGYNLNSKYFKTIVKHDPHFVDAYLHLAPATSLFSGKPKTTVSLMTKGLQSISPESPKSYLVWTYKGVDELLFLGDNQAAQKSYETAAEWAKYHDDKISKIIGDRARETADFLAINPDSKQAQVSSWMMIYSNSRDEAVKELALKRIEALGGELIITPNTITVKMPE